MQLPDLIKLLATEHQLAEDQANLGYSDEYTILEDEQQKLNSMHGEKPDYAKMVENGAKLIEQGAGHFFVITALANAMLQQYGWPGFAAGIEFIQQQLSQNWEKLYPAPERIKGRVQPMDWILERYVIYLEVTPVNSLGKDMVSRIIGALQSLDATCQTYFADEVNVVSVLRPFEAQQQRAELEAKARERQAKLDEEKQQREAEEAELRKQQKTLDVNAETISQDEYLENMNAVELHILASKRLMAEQLDILKSDLFCYAIYKHNRAEMWWRYPMSSSELLNLIDEQGFNWERYNECQRLKATQNYEDALLGFEALSHDYPFYLPLQWHICDCLEELGAEQSLIDMLKAECKALWQQYPELEDAKINNDLIVFNRHIRNYFELHKPNTETN